MTSITGNEPRLPQIVDDSPMLSGMYEAARIARARAYFEGHFPITEDRLIPSMAICTLAGYSDPLWSKYHPRAIYTGLRMDVTVTIATKKIYEHLFISTRIWMNTDRDLSLSAAWCFYIWGEVDMWLKKLERKHGS